ncbi:hypothetical protein L2E82_43038 [Cichorium intybus]|uniref:Uncharacterized protein n=1 Tax=Cichorium intybus TaxID=13427 RepID=A0ACB8ZNB4_CICIN|nr:hypothetical protein L2E82_43038 [Cichorium intybus]
MWAKFEEIGRIKSTGPSWVWKRKPRTISETDELRDISQLCNFVTYNDCDDRSQVAVHSLIGWRVSCGCAKGCPG